MGYKYGGGGVRVSGARHYLGKNKLSAFKAAGVRALVSDMRDALLGSRKCI